MRGLAPLTWEALDVFLGHLIDDPWDPGVDCTICVQDHADYNDRGQDQMMARFLSDYGVCWTISVPVSAHGLTKAQIREKAKACLITVDVYLLHVFSI
jgi:hypothetical protein